MTKRRDTTAEAANDAQVFRAAVRDVKPLASLPARVATPRPKPPRGRTPRPAGTVPDTEMPLVGADVGGEETLSHRRPGVRDQVLRRLRRGMYPIEGQLDLHGLNQAAARGLLADFIEYSVASGRRCVRVIHGKGMRSGSRGAVLKSAVNSWLRRHGDVMAFASARPIDGGTGAVYVLLRA